MSATGALPLEYLGREPRRRVPPWWVGLVLGAVCLAGVVAAWANALIIDRANQALGVALEQSQEQVAVGENQVLAALAYSQPMIWSSQWPESTRAGLRDLVQRSAAASATRVAGIRDDVTGTLVLPWQSAQREAQQQVLALIDADLARFDLIAADARAISEVMGSPRPSIAAAVESLRASGFGGPAIR